LAFKDSLRDAYVKASKLGHDGHLITLDHFLDDYTEKFPDRDEIRVYDFGN